MQGNDTSAGMPPNKKETKVE